MFMHIVKNKTYGNIAYTNMSEQMAKILRMGANDQSVIDRLNWMRDVQGPMLRDAMKIIGEIDLRLMLAQALHMGDECHNRNNAGTTLLIQALTPGDHSGRLFRRATARSVRVCRQQRLLLRPDVDGDV